VSDPMSDRTEAGGKRRVLFVHPTSSTFIRSDIEILKKHFDLRVVDLGSRRRTVRDMVGALWAMLKGVVWADIAYCWFAEGHAKWMVRLARIFGRPSVVVVGGYEVAKVPEVGHGSLLDPAKAKMVRRILERTTVVLAVSEFTRKEILACSSPKRVEIVHNCVDTRSFTPSTQKENLVLTVGTVGSRQMRLKGIDTFVETARLSPSVRFEVVGEVTDESGEKARKEAPENLVFAGRLPSEELRGLYGKAKVYCQLSMYESFGIAVAEAMSCECVPVVTKAGALPEVVGDTGITVPIGDAQAAARAVREALARPDGKKARERVKGMFDIEIRERELVRIIEGLVRR